MSARFLVYGGSWAMAGRLMANLTLVASQALVARLLVDKGQMGLFLLAYSLATTLVCVAQGGVNTAGMRFIAEGMAEKEGLRNALRPLVRRLVGAFTATSAIAAILLVSPCGTWFVGAVMGKAELAAVLVWVALWILMLVQERSLGDLLRGFKDIRRASMLTGAASGALLCVLLGVAVASRISLSLEAILALAVVSSAIAAGVGALGLKRNLDRHAPRGGNGGSNAIMRYRSIMKPALTMMMINTFAYLLSQADLWILGFSQGNEAVAMYGIPQRLVMLAQVPMAIVNSFLPPLLAESHAKGELRRRESEIRMVATIASLPSLLILIVFWSASRTVVELLYPGYGGGSTILSVLAVAQVVFVLVGPIGFTLLMTGNHGIVLGTTSTVLLVHVGAGSVAASAFGPLGLAVESAAAASCYFVALLLIGRKRLDIWTAADPRCLARLGEIWRIVRGAIEGGESGGGEADGGRRG